MAEGMDGNQSLTPLSDSSRKDECATREKDFDNNNKYKMNYREMGVCVILNMEKFDPKFKKEQRKGTDKDAEGLKKVFENIGFKVMIEENATIKRAIDVLKEVAKDDHSQRSCFVCIVLSHGEEGKFCCYDDFMDEEYLFNIFKGEDCRGLVGKPKLFFFQACRGDKKDPGVKLYSSSAAPSCTIPVEADFLCHYSTPPGYLAWRHPNNGSWFIQSLCEMLEKYWKEQELMHILTRVNYKVAYEFKARENKEMPCIVSKLTKDLYLMP